MKATFLISFVLNLASSSENLRKTQSCLGVSNKPDYLNMVNATPLIFYFNVIEVDGREAIKGQVEYLEKGWVSWGTSEDGHMAGGTAIIGFPNEKNDENNPKKFQMGGMEDAEWGVEQYPDVNMTTYSSGGFLTEANSTYISAYIEQTTYQTILYFEKYLEEAGDYPIKKAGVTQFILAAGIGNEIGYHKHRVHFGVRMGRAC